jgi:hypothetical protein
MAVHHFQCITSKHMSSEGHAMALGLCGLANSCIGLYGVSTSRFGRDAKLAALAFLCRSKKLPPSAVGEVWQEGENRVQ